ncbi:MAG: NUDIX hydrolase [Alphaproteobacteria bacterium]|nr:NUDIX hydrolase [Alphaproteobacteria bacterium]
MEQVEAFATPWFKLVAKKPIGSDEAPHYSIATADYVAVLALTERNEVLLVSQFRPAVECETIELPSGHLEPGETPEAGARRELLEETGFNASALTFLGVLKPDVGRLGNRLWCYFATACDSGQPPSEPGVALHVWPLRRLLDELAQPKQFDHALHLAVLALALGQGLLKLPPSDKDPS